MKKPPAVADGGLVRVRVSNVSISVEERSIPEGASGLSEVL